jgi:hypothetical protein
LQDLFPQFCAWADAVTAAPLPDGIAAFHFNMYEGLETYDIEIVGCPTYAPRDSDWACDDILVSKQPRFRLPHQVVGRSWEQALEVATRFVGAYLATGSVGAKKMQETLAVGIGFVDGDLHLVWSRHKA